MSAILDESMQIVRCCGEISVQAEGEYTDHDGGELRKIAGKMACFDIGDIKSHAFQPKTNIVCPSADIADTRIGQFHVEGQYRQHGRFTPDGFTDMRIAGDVCLPCNTSVDRGL